MNPKKYSHVEWCAMIYVWESRDVAGAVRRSKRLHWRQEDARPGVGRWVTEMGPDPVRWEIVDDERLVGRIRGHFDVGAFCRQKQE
ncbi:MAG: hypothetical protein JO282_12000 [Alphaproteobacteria bacterium]|nr:hypothetical protein [Alphaproteobacteria bacterium]